jgi:hypothetical protein
MSIAPNGHSAEQVPQPAHAASMTVALVLSSRRRGSPAGRLRADAARGAARQVDLRGQRSMLQLAARHQRIERAGCGEPASPPP